MIEPIARPWDQRGDPLSYVISKNPRRRHLNESQRSMVTAKIATLRDGQRADLVEGVPIGTAAQMMNVSERSAKRARVVLAKGVPELQRAVEAGNLAVSLAAEVAQHRDSQKKSPTENCANRRSFLNKRLRAV